MRDVLQVISIIILITLAILYLFISLYSTPNMKDFKIVEYKNLFTLYGRSKLGVWRILNKLCKDDEFIIKFPGGRVDRYYIKPTYKNKEEALSTLNKIMDSVSLARK